MEATTPRSRRDPRPPGRTRRRLASPWAVVTALVLAVGCREGFRAEDGDPDGTSTDDPTDDDTTDTSDTETGGSELLEPCETCWSGWCEAGGNRCALAVFVTSTQFEGSELGGVDGADMLCRLAAGGPGQPFRAWLSTATEPAPSHVNLLEDRIYVLPDGTVVAESITDFVAGGLLHPIDLGPQGQPAPDPTDDMACPSQGAWTVWTGTRADGAPAGATCGDWGGGQNGQVGRTDRTTGDWTDQCTSNCERVAALYCFQDPL